MLSREGARPVEKWPVRLYGPLAYKVRYYGFKTYLGCKCAVFCRSTLLELIMVHSLIARP